MRSVPPSDIKAQFALAQCTVLVIRLQGLLHGSGPFLTANRAARAASIAVENGICARPVSRAKLHQGGTTQAARMLSPGDRRSASTASFLLNGKGQRCQEARTATKPHSGNQFLCPKARQPRLRHSLSRLHELTQSRDAAVSSVCTHLEKA